MAGQPQLSSNDYFGLDAKSLVVSDPKGIPSEIIIDYDDPFDVSITLDFRGILCHFILGCCLCWEVHYCFEPVCFDDCGDSGKKTGKRILSPRYCPNEKSLPYDETTKTYSFGKDATIATVPAKDLAKGTYRVTAVVRFHCRCEHECRFKGVSAFTDGPLIEII